MRKQILVVALAAALSPLATHAQAQSSDSTWMPDMSEVHGTIGLRLWRTDWSTWYDVYEYHHADQLTAVIPVASLRYKNFLVSGSYMIRKEFEFPSTTEGAPPIPVKRNEYDVNVGYFIYPGLAATVGWKNIDYDNRGYHWRAKGLTVGLSGSAPLAPVVSLYGSAAYGWPKIDDGQTFFNDTRAKYLLTEVGLAFPLGQLNDALGRVVVTAGYRYQRVGAVPNFSGVEVFEYAQGPVLAITIGL
jgi:hypothetical protein